MLARRLIRLRDFTQSTCRCRRSWRRTCKASAMTMHHSSGRQFAFRRQSVRPVISELYAINYNDITVSENLVGLSVVIRKGEDRTPHCSHDAGSGEHLEEFGNDILTRPARTTFFCRSTAIAKQRQTSYSGNSANFWIAPISGPTSILVSDTPSIPCDTFDLHADRELAWSGQHLHPCKKRRDIS